MPALHVNSPVRLQIEQTPQTGIGDGEGVADVDVDVTRLDDTGQKPEE